MPMVSRLQAASVQGRIQRAQAGVDPALDQRRDRKREHHREADIAGVEERRVAGEAGILQQGFRSRPSAGTGKRRANGFEVATMNSSVPNPSSPWIARVRARRLGGRRRPKNATRPPNKASMKTQSIIEPSWLPQAPGDLVQHRLCEARILKDVEH